jgi:hypothetical protein
VPKYRANNPLSNVKSVEVGSFPFLNDFEELEKFRSSAIGSWNFRMEPV